MSLTRIVVAWAPCSTLMTCPADGKAKHMHIAIMLRDIKVLKLVRWNIFDLLIFAS
jgi:serine protease inhibitor ecotin